MRAHPHTLKYLAQGHPWVTPDSFNKNWPKSSAFIELIHQGFSYQLIHDPNHPKVCARLWQKYPSKEKPEDFSTLLTQRIEKAFLMRNEMPQINLRENFYLCFGEADQLPGLFLQVLGEILLLQLSSSWWVQHLNLLEKIIKNKWGLLKAKSPPRVAVWEMRMDSKFTQRKSWWGEELKPTSLVQEYGVNYLLHWGPHYDHGIYTDMAAIRKKLGIYLENSRVLNLYCYTGAFSLFALHNSASIVESVDLSGQYLEWLEENLKLNPQLIENGKIHRSIKRPVLNALKEYIQEQRQFDFIICDPPSFSSDGKRSLSSWQGYPELISLMIKLIPEGGRLVLFLNTHKIPRQKFKSLVQSFKELKVIEELALGADAPQFRILPEGDYLKGFVVQKNKLAND